MADRLEVMGRPADARSTGELFRDIVTDLQEMIHTEIRLGKAELAEKAKQAGQAGGMFGGAAVCGLMAGGCFVVTCIAALATAMPVWLAALLMGVLLTCTAWAMYLGGRVRWRRVNPAPERTVQTLRDDVAWAKHRTS